MTFSVLGEVSMQKVKVHRYVQGKRPEYAPESTSEEESDDDDFLESRKVRGTSPATNFDSEQMIQLPSDAFNDARLKRLGGLTSRQKDRRPLHEPQVVKDDSSDEDSDVERNRRSRRQVSGDEKDSNDEDGELSDNEIERRRQRLRQKVLNQTKDKVYELTYKLVLKYLHFESDL